MQGIKQRINNVILTGQGITNINKSDVAGKIALNIPVKISTGRLISTVRPEYRTAYALVRYISSRAFAKMFQAVQKQSQMKIYYIQYQKELRNSFIHNKFVVNLKIKQNIRGQE